MNWDAIGAMAELLGAIGVIASLVYLARQMRHNARATRASAFQQFDQTLHDAFSHTLTVPGMARVTRRLSDYEQLGEDEAQLFRAWLGALLMRLDNGYYQYRAGMLDEESWNTLRRMLTALISSPGSVQWWRSSPLGFFSSEFVALVEEILQSPGPRTRRRAPAPQGTGRE